MTIHRLRKKPLGDFTIEDLRIMISQNVGNAQLIPIAIEKLKENIWAEGDFYPGDLLNSVLTSDPSFWKTNQSLWKTVKDLVDAALPAIQTDKFHRKIIGNFDRFKVMYPG
jgi:hypothetical protein